MPDGKRKRRHSPNRAKRTWYAIHRARRFARRFGIVSRVLKPACVPSGRRSCIQRNAEPVALST
jgi:hypothetical protein